MISGGCGCGRIQYQIDGQPFTSVTACHCQQCQQTGGGPYLPFLDFKTSSLKWNKNPDIWKYSEVAQRFHCSVCGSTLGMQYFFDMETIGITMGTIQSSDEPIPSIKSHIFLKEKASWFNIPDDGTRRFDGFNAEFTSKMENWKAQQSSKKRM